MAFRRGRTDYGRGPTWTDVDGRPAFGRVDDFCSGNEWVGNER